MGAGQVALYQGLPPAIVSTAPTTAGTIDIMRRYARTGSFHPLVRAVAASIIATSDPHDSLDHARKIGNWVSERVQFMRDPADVEHIASPWAMLADIQSAYYTVGDCDDMATLVAALGLAVGLSAMFVTVGLDQPNAPFSHVYAALRGPGMPGWFDVDPARTETDGHRITTMKQWPV